MKKHLLKTMVAVLAIAATAAGPVRGQNASPDVTLDFTTNTWGLPTSGDNHGPESYSNGTYSITLYAPNAYRLNSGYLLLGKSGAYLQLPAFSSPVEKIEVVGNNDASAQVVQNVFVDDNNSWVAVSTQTTGATGTNTYVINESYRATGNIYFIKVGSGQNTQISKVYVYFAQAPAVPHTVRFADGNDGWMVTDVDSARSATAPAVLQNVMAGDSLVVTAPATLPGKVKSVKAVKYVPPVLVESITLNKQSTSIGVDSTMTLTATVLPDNATDKSVTWSSSNTGVATVDQNGVVTGVASGTAHIIATANDGSGVADTCTVSVYLVQIAIIGGVQIKYVAGDNWQAVVGRNPGVLYIDGEFLVRRTSDNTYLISNGEETYELNSFTTNAVWMNGFSVGGHNFYYNPGESWAAAINNHRSANPDWEIAYGYVVYDGDTYLTVGSQPLSPNAEVNPSITYGSRTLDD